ncbi:MAG: bifunctional phosphoribosyl-AMP cyclohydrolase/phosphoribosyl-ATP diphosphatase HisIE [Acidobacteria bacterium]|nr:bifunctional phosphoribosyl-AMP cyclohydrolase/phosphoribosyl-ATP diphosphatase HisIE [Acidobacteriota bacterium]
MLKKTSKSRSGYKSGSRSKFSASALDWEKVGALMPAVVQDSRSGRVLMLGYMNRKALDKTLKTGLVTFWTRTGARLWTKGETSGNYLRVAEIRNDCDGDALLIFAEPTGPTCHRGTRSCFLPDEQFQPLEFLNHLEEIILKRKRELPPGSYTTALFEKGMDEITKKLGEEIIEVIISTRQARKRSIEEAADLLYHLMVFLTARGLSMEDVVRELQQRHGPRDSK